MPAPVKPAKSASGEKPNGENDRIIAAVAYLGIVVAVLVYALKKEDRFARFHAIQEILFSVCYTVFSVLVFVVAWIAIVVLLIGSAAGGSGAGLLAFPLLWGGVFVWAGAAFLLKLVLMYKAYKGEWYRLPVIGRYAEKWST